MKVAGLTVSESSSSSRMVQMKVAGLTVSESSSSSRMVQMKVAGLTAVQTYVEWSSHQPEPNQEMFEKMVVFCW